jgi:hypothetical protein
VKQFRNLTGSPNWEFNYLFIKPKLIVMRSISIFCFFASFIIASPNSFGQVTCSASTSAPSGFTAITTILSTSDARLAWTSGASTPAVIAGTFQSSQTTVTSPVFYNGSTSPGVTVAFSLQSTASGPGGATTVNSYTLTVLYGVGGVTTIPCTGTTFTISNIATTYYFTISGSTIPAVNFQVKLTLNLPNGAKDITSSNFRANATERPGGVLPVGLSALDAKTINNSVSLKWNVATESGVSGYVIERSSDGIEYSKIGFINAKGQASYFFIDTRPLTIAYYRIKSVDVDGRYTYSSVAMVKDGKSMILLKAFPTPFTKTVSLQHATASAASLISITSVDGRLIKSVLPTRGAQQTDIDLSTAKPGLYLIRFNNGDGRAESLKILKQ